MIELCCEYLSVLCIWLYVLIMSHMRLKVNPHSIVAWMSRKSFLKTGPKSMIAQMYFSIFSNNLKMLKNDCNQNKWNCDLKNNIVFVSDLLWNLTTAEIPLAKIRNEISVTHLHSHRRVLENNMHIIVTGTAYQIVWRIELCRKNRQGTHWSNN